MSSTTHEGHVIYLLYDEAKLRDEARAKLISLLAEADPDDRKILAVTDKDQGIIKLIQNNYHLSGITDKLSVEALADAIRTINGLANDRIRVGQSLVAPALPMRAYRIDKRDQPSFRIAPVGFNDVALATGSDGLRQGTRLPIASEPRYGQLTAKQLADPRYVADLAWKNGKGSPLPVGVHPIQDGGDLQIHLADATKCELHNWLNGSPFYGQLKASIANFLSQPGSHDLLTSRAASLPLVVIDWNDSDKKHGQKVNSVVKYLLAELGVGDLTVREVDLNPANNSTELRGIFVDYLQNHYCVLQGIDCNDKGEKALVSDVNQWLKSKPKTVNGIATLKQLLLEAILWKFFSKEKAIVNMSFSVDSLALEILQAQFLAASQSVGIVAASDDSQPQGTVGIPQRAASVYPNFVNITYGNPDGTILGGYSNDHFNIVVTTIAQGCGFTYGDIASSDAGTSFATPYVAAAVWLRALMVGPDVSTVRRDIVEASDVSRVANLPQVESLGPFDFAAFLLPVSFEVLDSRGGAQNITQGTLTLKSVKPTGGTVVETFTTGEHLTIAFFHDGSTLKARIRHLRGTGPPIPVADPEERTIFACVLDVVSSSGAAHYEMAEMGNSILEVRF